MNNSEWCVIFAINDKVQNFTTCYNTNENAVYEYCREEADKYSEESGRSLFNTQILDPEQKMVEMYIGKDYYCWVYFVYDSQTDFSDLDRLYHSKTDESVVNSWD